MGISKDKIIKNISYLKKKSYLKKVTDGLGEVIEEENRFICNVNKKIIKKRFKDFVCVNLYLKSYDRLFKNMKNGYEFDNINKPLYYVFDGVEFDGLVLSTSDKVGVIFKNCLFKKYVNVNGCREVVFENNEYYNRSPIYPHCNNGKFFVVKADNVKFMDATFYNRDEQHHVCKFGMDIKCNNIEFLNSYVFVDNSVKVNDCKCGNELGEFSVMAKNGVFYMSDIEAPNIFMEMDNIVCDGVSDFAASKGIIIDVKNYNAFLANIDTSYLVWNGRELINNDSKTIVTNKDLDLQKSRVKLIEELKAIRDEVGKINQERLNKVIDVVKEELDGKPLKRVLRK